jgi:hypothetical protein
MPDEPVKPEQFDGIDRVFMDRGNDPYSRAQYIRYPEDYGMRNLSEDHIRRLLARGEKSSEVLSAIASSRFITDYENIIKPMLAREPITMEFLAQNRHLTSELASKLLDDEKPDSNWKFSRWAGRNPIIAQWDNDLKFKLFDKSPSETRLLNALLRPPDGSPPSPEMVNKVCDKYIERMNDPNTRNLENYALAENFGNLVAKPDTDPRYARAVIAASIGDPTSPLAMWATNAIRHPAHDRQALKTFLVDKLTKMDGSNPPEGAGWLKSVLEHPNATPDLVDLIFAGTGTGDDIQKAHYNVRANAVNYGAKLMTPEQLQRYSKDPSLQVKSIIAKNPRLPPEAMKNSLALPIAILSVLWPRIRVGRRSYSMKF